MYTLYVTQLLKNYLKLLLLNHWRFTWRKTTLKSFVDNFHKFAGCLSQGTWNEISVSPFWVLMNSKSSPQILIERVPKEKWIVNRLVKMKSSLDKIPNFCIFLITRTTFVQEQPLLHSCTTMLPSSSGLLVKVIFPIVD